MLSACSTAGYVTITNSGTLAIIYPTTGYKTITTVSGSAASATSTTVASAAETSSGTVYVIYGSARLYEYTVTSSTVGRTTTIVTASDMKSGTVQVIKPSPTTTSSV